MTARRILYVCDFNAHGGTQTHLIHLLGSLDRGRVVPWLAPLTLRPDLGERLARLGVEVTDLGLRRAVSLHTAGVVIHLARAVRRRGVDLVHGYLFQGNLLAAGVSRLAGVPCVTSVRNLDIWKKGRHRLASSLAHRRAERVLFNSAKVRDEVAAKERIDPARTVVIPNGIPDPPGAEPDGDLGRLLQGDGPGGGPVVVCVASLRAKKGHHHLLEAFRRVRRAAPSARLVLLGEGPLRGDLEREAAEPGLAGSVILAGHRGDVASILRRCDLFVLSSLEEGMPNALLEAMAASLPAVVTDVGGNAEAVEERITGFLVPPADPAALAARMSELLADPGLRRRMGEAGRRRFESRFTLAAMTASYHALYDGILERPAR